MNARRNIGILAHIDAGKTTVTEHLLHVGGSVARPGSVDAGTTVTDWMVEEQERGITIASAASSFMWRDVAVTLVDTPGHVDFTIEVERSLRVLDGAVLVISGPDGVQAQTETVWHQAAHHALPAIGFVNKLDREGFALDALLAAIRERLGVQPIVLQVPIVDAERIRLVDVISGEVHDFDRDDGEPCEGAHDVAALDDEAQVLRMEALDALVDAASSHDDAYAEAVLEGREPTADEHRRALAKAVAARAVLPLVFGAARLGVGVDRLADTIVELVPPAHARSFATFPTSDGARASSPTPTATSATPSVYVFKTEPRRRGVRLAFVRVVSGRVASGDVLVRTPSGERLAPARVVRVIGQDYDTIDALEAGEIGALLIQPGEVTPMTGDTLGAAVLPFTFERLRPPMPVLELPIEAPDPNAHERMIAELTRLTEDDPSLRLGTDPQTGRAVLAGMGELHLEIARQRAERALGLSLRAGHLQVRARRILREVGRGEAQVSHPTGRARVRIEVEAAPRDGAEPTRGRLAGARVATSVLELERSDWRDAVTSGLEGAAGVDGRGGPELLDARIAAIAIDHHGSDVVPVMFRDAAEWAALRAIEAARPQLAEPWCALVVLAPDAAIGRVVGDLARRGARVRKTESRGAIQELTVEAPLGQLIGYASELRSITGGRGQFSLEPIGYRPVED